ncbi:TSUP family transporter [Yunchengibacter salinarum]|uniref:TSUP family transporter n=1 Tax=Yunchengibacter salinarum TaxID=3133399 RepID=UPI0035B5B1AC
MADAAFFQPVADVLDRLMAEGIATLLAMLGAIFLAAVLRAFTGFGFALGALPVLGAVLQPGTAVSVVVLLTLLVSLTTLRGYWGRVPVGPMAPILVLSLLGTLLGARLLALIDKASFQLLVGVVVMLSSLLLMRQSVHVAAPPRLVGWLAGLASGVLNGAVAVPGPPVIVYAMARFRDAADSRAFLMVFFLFSSAAAVIAFAFGGYLGLEEMLLVVAAYPAMVAGDRLGFFLFWRYGSSLYRRVAVAGLFLMGAASVAQAVMGAA